MTPYRLFVAVVLGLLAFLGLRAMFAHPGDFAAPMWELLFYGVPLIGLLGVVSVGRLVMVAMDARERARYDDLAGD